MADRKPEFDELFHALRVWKEKDVPSAASDHTMSESPHWYSHKFDWMGIPVHLIRLKKHDLKVKGSFKQGPLNKEVQAMIDEKVDPRPTDDMVIWTMSEIRAEYDRKSNKEQREMALGRKGSMWSTILQMARKKLWTEKAQRQALVEAMKSGRPANVPQKTFDEAREKVDAWKRNGSNKEDKCHQLDRDTVAAADEEILPPMNEADNGVFVVMDAFSEFLVVAIDQGLQQLYGQGVVDNLIKSFDVFGALTEEASLKDGHRHSMDDEWVREHPNYGRTKETPLDDESLKWHGVWHYGAHFAIGQSGLEEPKPMKDMLWKDEDTKIQLVDWQEKLFRGPFSVQTNAVRQYFRWTDSETCSKCEDFNRVITPRLNTVQHELFSIRAVLYNTPSENHIDRFDMEHGYAWLTSVGNYEGSYLLVPELRFKVRFRSGTVIGVRGREIYHSSTAFQGESRYCVVHTNHQDMYKYSQELIKTGKTPAPENDSPQSFRTFVPYLKKKPDQ